MPADVECRLLGPVDVVVNGVPRDLGPARQRCVLAMLLSNIGRPLTTDAMVDGLWGADAPPNAPNTLYSYLSRLRSILRDTGLRVSRQDGGYLIDAAEEQVDVHRNPLWDGEPLAGIPGPWATEARAELRRRRLNVLIEWAERELADGHADKVASRLRPLVAEYPLAETLIAHLLRALHAIGEHDEAETRYQETVSRLADELGTQPGPALTSAHNKSVKDNRLPPAPADFVGRTRELAILESATGILVVSGTGGVGKTALALAWAHQATERFPDGRLYVDLRGYSQADPLRPIDALSVLLRELGLSPNDVPLDEDTAAGLYRSTVANRKVLVLLDNAVDTDQVRPLLPGTAGSLALVTSRDRMTALLVTEGAKALRLESMAEHDAHEMLAAGLGHDRVAAEPDAAAEITRSCAHLPLALRIAAADLHDHPATRLSEYVTQLQPAAYGPIQAAFDLSYQRLPDDHRALFRLLSLHVGPDVTADTAGALAGIPRADATRKLGRLAGAHLIEPASRGRYTLHDLLRQFAKHRSDQEDSAPTQHAAVQRLTTFYVATANRAATVGAPTLARLPLPDIPDIGPPIDTDEQALAWLDAEHVNLAALVLWPPSPDVTWHVSDILRGYYQIRSYHVEWQSVARTALRAATTHGGDKEIASAWLSLGYLYRNKELQEQAIHAFTEARTHAEHADWPAGTATVLTQLGWVYPKVRRASEAIECLHQAIEIAAAAGEPAIEATAHGNLGSVYERIGRLPEALVELREELRLTQASGSSKYREANALSDIGITLTALGEYDEAIVNHERAVQLASELGAESLEMYVRVELAGTYAAAGHLRAAEKEADFALSFAAGHLFGDIEAVACGVLGYVNDHLGDHDRARRWHERAVAAAAQAGDPRVLAIVTTMFAEHSKDRAIAVRAVALTRTFEMRVLEARATNALAMACGRTKAATTYATRSLRLSRETGNRPGEERAQATLNALFTS